MKFIFSFLTSKLGLDNTSILNFIEGTVGCFPMLTKDTQRDVMDDILKKTPNAQFFKMWDLENLVEVLNGFLCPASIANLHIFQTIKLGYGSNMKMLVVL